MKPRNIILALVVVVFIGVGYAFRPDRLFINRTVDESLPANFTAGTQDLATGTFHTVLHPTQGDASIYRNADGNRILRLTDFKTTNGPDVHIYMVAAERPSDNASVRSSAFIDLGEMKGNVGDQNYTLGPGVDLSKYRSVVIWCKRFSFNFGYAPLTLSQVSRN
ncbi:MAG: DM13 domain-containing protein [Acidobacteriaceae bacterium]